MCKNSGVNESSVASVSKAPSEEVSESAGSGSARDVSEAEHQRRPSEEVCLGLIGLPPGRWLDKVVLKKYNLEDLGRATPESAGRRTPSSIRSSPYVSMDSESDAFSVSDSL